MNFPLFFSGSLRYFGKTSSADIDLSNHTDRTDLGVIFSIHNQYLDTLHAPASGNRVAE